MAAASSPLLPPPHARALVGRCWRTLASAALTDGEHAALARLLLARVLAWLEHWQVRLLASPPPRMQPESALAAEIPASGRVADLVRVCQQAAQELDAVTVQWWASVLSALAALAPGK